MVNVCKGLTALGLMDRMCVQRLRLTHTDICTYVCMYVQMYVNAILKRGMRQVSKGAQRTRMLLPP